MANKLQHNHSFMNVSLIKKTWSLIIILILGANVMAQKDVKFKSNNFPKDPKGFQKAMSNLKTGDNLVNDKRNFREALNYYLPAHDFNPNNAELNFKIGVCYFYSEKKHLCLPYLEKAYELDPKVNKDICYFLGRGCHINYEFDKAIQFFELFKNQRGVNSEYLKSTPRHIEECLNGKVLVQDTLFVDILNLGANINTEYSEYNPLITADGEELIFISRRKGTTGNKVDTNDGMFNEDVYTTSLVDGKWTVARNIGKPINTPRHDAVLGLSPDGQQLLVYLDINEGDIGVSYLSGTRWTKPVPLGQNINSQFHESKACLSPDGKTLYFISNNPKNSLGGRDIFVSKADKDGDWSPAENIGKTINTKYNEEGVFMHPDGRTLYFSSQGHNSMGGYDIFKTVMDSTGEWTTPVNVGFPINTPGDDVFYTVCASGKKAYFASYREDGYGMYDIYEIRFKEKTTENIADIKTEKVLVTILKGTVKDSKTHVPIEAKIEIIDNVKNEVIATFNSNSATGRYLVSLPSGRNYGINVNHNAYLFHSENFDIADTTDYQEIVKDIYLQKIEVGTKVVLRNIFFDYNKATLRAESTAELDKLVGVLKKESMLRIEISGHTDNIGNYEYNKKLSEDRAKSVVDYLVKQGIDKTRLEYAGYAFDQPISDNDSEEGRQLNRRVEFKVLSH